MSLSAGTVLSVNRRETYTFSKPMRDEIVLLAGIGVEGDVHAGVRVKHRHRVKIDPTQPNLRQVHLIQAEVFGEVGERGYTVTPGDLGENVTTSGIDLLRLPLGTILRFGLPEAIGLAGSGGLPGGGLPGGGLPGGGLPGGGLHDGGESGHPLEGVLETAAAATLDGPTAAAAAVVAAVVGRDPGADPRPAVIVTGLRNPCAQINTFQTGLLKEMIGHDENGDVVRKAGVMAVVLHGGVIRPGDPVVVELPPSPFTPLERV